MAVVWVREDYRDRGAVVDSTGVTRYTRRWLIETDSALDGPAVVLAHASIPSILDTYTSGNDVDANAACERVTAGLLSEDSQKHWEVAASYTTGPLGDSSLADDPLDRPTEVEFDQNQYQIVADVDTNGDAITNTAGDPFTDPPIEIDQSRPVVTLTRNEAAFNFSVAQDYTNKVNSLPWWGAAAETVLCRGIRATRVVEGRTAYWRVTYTFEFRDDDWHAKPLQAGYYEIDDTLTGDKRKRIKDDEGADVVTPWPIDANGVKIARTSLPDAAIYGDFEVYQKEDFNALGLLENLQT